MVNIIYINVFFFNKVDYYLIRWNIQKYNALNYLIDHILFLNDKQKIIMNLQQTNQYSYDII